MPTLHYITPSGERQYQGEVTAIRDGMAVVTHRKQCYEIPVVILREFIRLGIAECELPEAEQGVLFTGEEIHEI